MVRIKERYLLVNILYPSDLGTKPNLPDLVVLNPPTSDSLNPQTLLRALRAQIASLFGDYGSGACAGGGLMVKYLSQATSTFILRISRAHFRLVWAALTTMDRVPVKDGKPCTFRVVHVSGTIRKAEEEAIRRARDMMLAVKDQKAVKGNPALESLLGNAPQRQTRAAVNPALGVEDESDQDEEMEDISDG